MSDHYIEPWVIIPGGATGHIQAPDVSWNKPMTDMLREMYDQWMDEGPHSETKDGNMRGPPLKLMTQWILKAWSKLDREVIIKSFRCCALSVAVDGLEDDEISCFKPGKTLSSGLERLKNAMEANKEAEVDPFEINDSDVEDNPDDFIDDDEDEDVDINVDN